MTDFNVMNQKMDDQITVLRRLALDGTAYEKALRVAELGDTIELFRDAIKKEMEGLRGDVRSAESAYESVNAAREALEQEKDQWLNVQLPGWRKRVTEAEQQRELWKQNFDRVANELQALALHADELEAQAVDLRLQRDDWKRDAAECDNRTESAHKLVGTLKNENDSLRARLDEALKRVDVLGSTRRNCGAIEMSVSPEEHDYIAQVCAEDAAARKPRKIKPRKPDHDDRAFQPVPPAGEVEVLAVVTLGSFSSEELGEIDVEPQMKTLERLQQQLVTSEDVSLELVDGAHVTRLTAERDALQSELAKARELLEKALVVVTRNCTSNWSSQIKDGLTEVLAAPPQPDHSAQPDENSEWEDTFGPDYEVDGDDVPRIVPGVAGLLPVRHGYCQCGRLVQGSPITQPLDTVQGDAQVKVTLSSLLADLPDGYIKDDVTFGWNACLDEFARLNKKT